MLEKLIYMEHLDYIYRVSKKLRPVFILFYYCGFVFEASRNMAFKLNRNQRIAVVRHYYRCGSNVAEASRRFSEEFHIHVVQGRNIKSLVNKFETTGSVNDAPRSGRPTTATSDEKGEQLEASLINSSRKSVRRLSRELEISRQSVYNLLRKRNLKLYIPRLFHALHDGDADRRLR